MHSEAIAQKTGQGSVVLLGQQFGGAMNRPAVRDANIATGRPRRRSCRPQHHLQEPVHGNGSLEILADVADGRDWAPVKAKGRRSCTGIERVAGGQLGGRFGGVDAVATAGHHQLQPSNSSGQSLAGGFDFGLIVGNWRRASCRLEEIPTPPGGVGQGVDHRRDHFVTRLRMSCKNRGGMPSVAG